MAEPTLAPAPVERGRLPLVLMYHSVDFYTEDPHLVTVRPDRFAEQLRWLRRQGLRGVSMAELLAARRFGGDRGLIGLTFDDGYTDFHDQALPILSRYGCTATVFVIAGRLGGDNEWDRPGPRKTLMSAEQVQAVAAAGIEIGSHGMQHVSLPNAAAGELPVEIVDSRRRLQELTGQSVDGFCYPYGDISGPVVDTVRAAGYDYGCAIWRSEHTGRLALPRTFVGDGDGALRLVAKQLRHRIGRGRPPVIRNT